jgi:hypothetical protein
VTFHIGTPRTRGAGYLINNQALGVGQGRQEADIRTCPHCEAIIDMQKWKNDGAWCSRCDAPVCGGGNGNPACVAERRLLGCVPFLRKLEKWTRGQTSLAMFRRLAGLDSSPPPNTPRKIIIGGK